MIEYIKDINYNQDSFVAYMCWHDQIRTKWIISSLLKINTLTITEKKTAQHVMMKLNMFSYFDLDFSGSELS